MRRYPRSVVVSRLSDQIGRVLGGRYRLIAPIGTGASALVFLADDTRLRRRVAVKLLHQALSSDESFLRRFRAEAQAAAALNHPHILAVYDWGEDDDEPYLITEYLGGGSLRAMLDTGARLDVAQALLIGLETARGLDYAHKRGFVHRDIKPANLLFGEEGRLRIADFGLARALAEAAWTRRPAGDQHGSLRMPGAGAARRDRQRQGRRLLARPRAHRGCDRAGAPLRLDRRRLDGARRQADQRAQALGPLRKVLARAGNPDPDQRPDAGELAVGLLAAAEDLSRPAPLPLAGTAAAIDSLVVAERDPTQLPTSADATAAVSAAALFAADAPAASAAEIPPPPAEVVLDSGPRAPRRWPKALGIVLAAMAIFVASFVGYRTLHTPSHDVPDLTHMPQADAEAAIAAQHWKSVVNNTRQDGTVAGQVISQDPAAGKSLKEGKTVTLLVSLGQTLVPVPGDLVGKPLADATAELQQAGLAVGATTEAYDENVPKGSVIKVADGTAVEGVEKGKPVDLVVSKGPEPRTVPAIAAGTTYDAAAKQLTDIGLVPSKAEDFDDTVAAGNVISVNPPAGTQVDRSSTVEIKVSKGKPVVPDVKGKSVADAIDTLQAAGFTVSGVQGNPLRSVQSTSPAAGTQAAKGTGVTLITK